MSEILIQLENIVVLRQTDPTLFGVFGKKGVRALDGVSLPVRRGETLGLMGGSGSGKSTLAEAATLRLAVSRGRILIEGRDAARLGGDERKRLRRRLQLIRQDARESLDMEHSIRRQFMELLRHNGLPESESQVASALESVGLGAELLNRTPLELSGGQQQRLAIARSLAVNPLFVAGDEPVSGVDPHTQLDLLRLLERVQQERHITYMLISHDRRVIGRLAHQVAMLYRGRLCEVGPVADVFASALHPYSRLFLGQESGAMPPDEDQATTVSAGCPWAQNCPGASDKCRHEAPPPREVASGHRVACHMI